MWRAASQSPETGGHESYRAETRAHENIVISVADLKRIAPDFKAGDAIVTTSDAATLEEDARTLQTTELPSQADDLDGDNNTTSLVFRSN